MRRCCTYHQPPPASASMISSRSSQLQLRRCTYTVCGPDALPAPATTGSSFPALPFASVAATGFAVPAPVTLPDGLTGAPAPAGLAAGFDGVAAAPEPPADLAVAPAPAGLSDGFAAVPAPGAPLADFGVGVLPAPPALVAGFAGEPVPAALPAGRDVPAASERGWATKDAGAGLEAGLLPVPAAGGFPPLAEEDFPAVPGAMIFASLAGLPDDAGVPRCGLFGCSELKTSYPLIGRVHPTPWALKGTRQRGTHHMKRRWQARPETRPPLRPAPSIQSQVPRL